MPAGREIQKGKMRGSFSPSTSGRVRRDLGLTSASMDAEQPLLHEWTGLSAATRLNLPSHRQFMG